MDKYAPYVWSAYAIALGLLSFTSAAILLRLYNARRKLDALERQDADT